MEYKHLCTTRQFSFRHVEKNGHKKVLVIYCPQAEEIHSGSLGRLWIPLHECFNKT